MNPVNKQISEFEKVIISDEKTAAAVVKAISIVLPKVSAYMSKMTMSIISRDNRIASLERKLANVGQFVPEVTVDEVTQTINEEVIEEQKVDRIAQMKAAAVEVVAQDAEVVAMSDGVPMVEGVPAGILEAPMEEITGVKEEEAEVKEEVKPAPAVKTAKKKSKAKKVKPLTEISI